MIRLASPPSSAPSLLPVPEPFLQASEDLPPAQIPLMGRGSSLATTGIGSSFDNSPGNSESTPIHPSPTSRTAMTLANMDGITQPHDVPPPIKASPSFSHSPSTAESLQYSEDSSAPQSPAALSPLHPVSLSPHSTSSDSSKQHRSAIVRTTSNSPDSPLTSPLDYRGANRDGKKKKKQQQVDGDGSSGDAGVGTGSVEQRRRGRSAILSLFGMFGGGDKRRGSQTVQDGGSSTETSPPVVHMMDEGFESEDAAKNEANAAEQGMAGAAKTLGRTGDRSSGVRKVAGVADVHAAFGLHKDKDDEEDGTVYYRSTGFLGGGKKKKRQEKEVAVLSSGIGGYGGILGGARSGPDDSTDLAEAARAIPHPLFGDPSRAVGRQNNRRGNRAHRTPPGTSAVTVTAAPAGVSDTAFASTTSKDKAFATVTSNTAVVVPGNSLDLANAYGLDVGAFGEQQSPLPATTPTTTSTSGAVATTQVNPLFDAGSAGGGRVRALAKAFDVEAQAVAVSGGLAVNNNKIGLPGKKAIVGKEKGRGGGEGEGGSGRGRDGAGTAVGVVGGSGSTDVGGVFTIEESEKEEKDEDEDSEVSEEA